MNHKSFGGLLVLILFWVFSFLFIQRYDQRSVPAPSPTPLLLEPLTIHEKILLGASLPINQLSQEDWDALPKIGPKLAQRIVAYRERNGPFKKLEDLLQVSGMGPKTLEAVRPFLSSSF